MKTVKLIKTGLLLIVFIFIVWFVWPTPYRYFVLPYSEGTSSAQVIRVHRVTGDLQVLNRSLQGKAWISRKDIIKSITPAEPAENALEP